MSCDRQVRHRQKEGGLDKTETCYGKRERGKTDKECVTYTR